MPNHHILYAGIYIIMMTCKLGTRRKKTNNQSFHFTQKVTLTYMEKQLSANGYYDPGNMLYDNYNKTPVIILDYNILKNWMSQEAFELFKKYEQTGEFNYPAFAELSNIKMYPLPYKTIGVNFKLMPAFCLTSLYYPESGKKYEHVTAGISQFPFMNKAKHQILLHERLKPIREEYSND